MLRLLRVTPTATPRRETLRAHRGFQLSLVVTGVRCLVTYLLLPVAGPALSLSGAVIAPIGIALSLLGLVSGTASLRRFWRAQHRARWMYTAFILVVFLMLLVTLGIDLARLAGSWA